MVSLYSLELYHLSNYNHERGEIMPEMKLPTIPQPDEGTRAVLQSNKAPMIKGGGEYSYQCGNCGAFLIEGIEKGQIRNIVILCPRCGRYNELV